jgi:transcription elongation GreA/GreB family factor
MRTYFFLRHDFARLVEQIETIRTRIREFGQEMGASCGEGAETYHDNFAYEDGVRCQHMWSRRLRELLGILNRAVVVSPAADANRVAIGTTVTYLDLQTDTEHTMSIGSFMTFERAGMISYASPLGSSLVGAEVGDLRYRLLDGEQREMEVLDVQLVGAAGVGTGTSPTTH